VLSKPEFDDGVKYNELEILMDNFGALKSSFIENIKESIASNTNLQSYSSDT